MVYPYERARDGGIVRQKKRKKQIRTGQSREINRKGIERQTDGWRKRQGKREWEASGRRRYRDSGWV